MIYKAIVESVIDKYHAKIRIPITDGVKTSSTHTADKDLSVASICALPNCAPNINVGDIVFVAMESTYPRACPVIIGHLYTDSNLLTKADLKLDTLSVDTMCSLPDGTSIGGVSYEEIRCLIGANESLQKQLDDIFTRLINIESRLFQNDESSTEEV